MERKINPPTKRVDETGYATECQFALHTAFNHLLDQAKKAGWDELQVALSLVSLCDTVIYGDSSNLLQ
ncbi:hypothetical protein L614_004200000100 [Ochrobactrum sp. J50]|uniref:Uncharacterized protein n=2 Tax=Brucella TaxID=234 RepID=A0A7V6PCT1_9HYPH|nr:MULTISPECIES: hypothetical protein [Brucella/Ochrobactrum group]MCR5944352.1 hypothetical protein [Ochrobactrum sp. XJ1]KAB2675395.1 hypothetical protein F9L08_27865 [Brucella tritici]MCH6206336.1 hypothetical protein [Brucella ciceri]NKC23357.1 hypothetical protein [Brucella oryzae]TWG98331.1 hypothetical protein L614_004200000100 [Ochrobactrum sp. J50]